MTTLQLGAVTVDLEQRVALRGGEPVPLARKEAEILLYLAARPNLDVPREELYEQVWGYRPSVVSRTLDTTVHRLRTKIEENPSDPAFLRTVHGLGYRLVYASLSEGERPAGPAQLVGRDAELRELLAASDPVLVHGPPGMGKSALLAREARERPETTWIDASELSDPEAAAALASTDAPHVVVDELDRVGPALAAAIARDPRPVRLGARSAVGWSGRRIRLGPLPVPAACQLLASELVALGVPAPEQQQIHALVEVVDRVPGLLVAAARTVPAIGVRTLTERLGTHTAALDAPLCARMQEIVVTDWCQLDEHQRALLVQAVQFGAEAPVTALSEALAGEDPDVVGRLPELFERGWLAPAEHDGRVRLYWHMRTCVHRVAGLEEREEARTRLVRWAEARAAEILPDAPGDPALIGPLRRALGACGEGDDRIGIVRALNALYAAAGSAEEHRALLDDTLARGGLAPEIEAELLVSRARLALHHLDLGIEADVDRVLSLLGTGALVQHALGIRALYRQYVGRVDAADADLDTAARHAADDERLQAILKYAQGQVLHERGRLDLAEAAFRDAHERAVRVGDLSVARQSLVKLAVTLADELRIGAAMGVLAQAARLVRPGAPGRFAASITMLEGQLALLGGDRVTAERAYEHARSGCVAMGLHAGAAAAETALAWLRLAEDDPESALQLCVSALDRWPLHRNAARLGATRAALAATHLVMGEHATAVELFEEARRDFRLDPRHGALAEAFLALALAAVGDRDEALQALERARTWYDEHPDRLGRRVAGTIASLLDSDRWPAPEGSPPEPYASVLRRLSGLFP